MGAPKIPKRLTRPVDAWTEVYGMRRAIAVLRHEAKILRKCGMSGKADDLMRVARALSASINRGAPSSEADALQWAVRSAAAWDGAC